MSLAVTPPVWLNRLDCAKITFVLRFVDSVEIPAIALLQLRREFIGALKELEQRQDDEVVQLVKSLLFQEPLDDPVIHRLVQKPSAAVILSPDCSMEDRFVSGNRIALPALFVGDGIVCINAFLVLLQTLGERGLFHGRGRFVVDTLIQNDGSSEEQRFDAAPGAVTPTIVPFAWMLNQKLWKKKKVKLEVVTPIRLIKKGKPMFKLTVKDFFTALVRRISSQAALHTGEEVDMDHCQLVDLAVGLECREYDLHWHDWRHLEGRHRTQGIGGLTGSMTLAGDSLKEIFWLLELGSLLHVGKGASYGYGRFRLVDVVD